MKKIKISIVTSTRADFGIFFGLIKKLISDKKFDLKLIVTGSHLSKKYGFTINEIKKRKIKIAKRIQISPTDDSKLGIIKTSSQAILKIGKVLLNLKPDMILLLGDRYEILSIAQSAVILHIPVVHFHGGELTQNSYDNYFRHAISKLSNIHFASTEVYKKRLIKMGESPKSVFNVGSMSLENAKEIDLYQKKEIEKKLKIRFLNKIILFTLHPETLNPKALKKQIQISFNSLNKIKDTTVIITSPNHDIGSSEIISMKKKICKKKHNFYFFHSLGRKMFFSCLKFANLVVGNSSSGIIEAPLFKKYSINLGDRQKGREMSKSVISVDFKEKKIKKAIKNYMHKRIPSDYKNPYYKKNSSKKVLEILKKINLKKIKFKNFYE